MGWPCQITRGSLVARSWRNISFKHPPPPLSLPLPPANYPIVSALITNLHQTDALLKHWPKAEKVNVKIIKVRRLFEKGPPSCFTQPREGKGGPTYVKSLQKGWLYWYSIVEMCHISMPELFILSAPIYILHLFMCEGISFKSYLQINDSSFRVRVIYDFLYFSLKFILLCRIFISFMQMSRLFGLFASIFE